MANKKKREQKPGDRRQQSRPQARQQSQPQSRQRAQQQRRGAPSGMSRGSLVAIVAAASVLIVLLLIGLNVAGAFGRTPTVGATSIKGNPDAKVTVEEFSDFQCPYCAQFALGTFPRIDKEYIESGKVRWVFRNMARIGEESKQAAQAAECAGEQGQYWQYHDKLFSSQQGENKGGFSTDKLKGFAKSLNLDTEAFNSCLGSGKYSDLINKDLVEGNQRGVNGTPTFFINGRKVEGALPYAEFQKALDTALK